MNTATKTKLRDDLCRSLKMRAARLARLAELNPPLTILHGEKRLIDIALFRLLNVEQYPFERGDEIAEQVRELIRNLRDQQSDGIVGTSFRLNDEAAYGLAHSLISNLCNSSVVRHCQQENCEWFKREEEEAKNV